MIPPNKLFITKIFDQKEKIHALYMYKSISADNSSIKGYRLQISYETNGRKEIFVGFAWDLYTGTYTLTISSCRQSPRNHAERDIVGHF